MLFCEFWKNFQEQLFEEHLGKVTSNSDVVFFGYEKTTLLDLILVYWLLSPSFFFENSASILQLFFI